MADRYNDGFRSQVAFVTHTRDYRSADVLPSLARHGFTTTERPHDRETERLVAQFDPDIVVLAIDPRHDEEVALVRQVARASKAQVIVVAPGPHPHGLSVALEAGADICLRDTDGAEMFNAQLDAMMRRRTAARPEAEDDGPSTITVRDLMLDFDRCQAVRDSQTIPLTPTEFKILAYLAKNAGKVVSPVEILRAVQDYTYSEREAQEIVKVYIRRIRRKVEADPAEPSYIVNVRGFGYMLERRSSRRDSARSIEAA
jgi:two-component system KDP operon response regulator KdpE